MLGSPVYTSTRHKPNSPLPYTDGDNPAGTTTECASLAHVVPPNADNGSPAMDEIVVDSIRILDNPLQSKKLPYDSVSIEDGSTSDVKRVHCVNACMPM